MGFCCSLHLEGKPNSIVKCEHVLAGGCPTQLGELTGMAKLWLHDNKLAGTILFAHHMSMVEEELVVRGKVPRFQVCNAQARFQTSLGNLRQWRNCASHEISSLVGFCLHVASRWFVSLATIIFELENVQAQFRLRWGNLRQ